MTYRYILRIKHQGISREISVEAWPTRKELASINEKRRPSFIIGSLSGERTILVDYIIKDLAKKYDVKKTRKGFKIIFPEKNIHAIAEAYKIGLLLATISIAKNYQEAENILHYIEKCTPEEIWFWTSKYLGIIRKDAKPEKVVEALALLAK